MLHSPFVTSPSWSLRLLPGVGVTKKIMMGPGLDLLSASKPHSSPPSTRSTSMPSQTEVTKRIPKVSHLRVPSGAAARVVLHSPCKTEVNTARIVFLRRSNPCSKIFQVFYLPSDRGFVRFLSRGFFSRCQEDIRLFTMPLCISRNCVLYICMHSSVAIQFAGRSDRLRSILISRCEIGRATTG